MASSRDYAYPREKKTIADVDNIIKGLINGTGEKCLWKPTV